MNALRTNCTYKVISHSQPDGFRVDHFHELTEAMAFTSDVTMAGFDCLICQAIEVIEAEGQHMQEVAA